MAKKKILILGGGLSALSTGVHLLQEGGADRFEVTALCMEDHLGGKAASWRLPDGRYMEIGFHAVFGYYRSLQTLLARAGRSVEDPRWFTENQGVHLMYEQEARAVNRLDIPSGPLDVGALLNHGFFGYQGMSLREKLAAAAWMARTGAELLLRDLDEDMDEHSFTAWCVDTGLDIELTRKTWFRYVLDLAFNYPNAASAYVGMYGFQRLMGPENSIVYYLNGALSEVIVEPVANLYGSLGGTVQKGTMATSVSLDPVTRRITRVGTRPTADPGAAEQGLSLGTDFDEVVWTLPIDCTRTLLRTTADFDRAVLEEPQLRRIWGLRTVGSLSLRLWLPNKILPSTYDTVVMGTPQPTATIIDYANRVDELRNGPWGSVIEMEGQEGRHEGLTDRELVRECLRNLDELPFVDSAKLDVDACLAEQGEHRWLLQRNAVSHLRYVLMEPGHWRHRPDQHQSPYDNLVFAGDWMQGTQPTASMEAAVRTGRVAADILRARHNLPTAVA